MASVSVVLFPGEDARFLDDCIASLLGQTLPDLEILCCAVDDNERQAISGIERRFDDPRLKALFLDCSLENARLSALEHARGTYCFFGNPRDFYEPGMLEEAARVLEDTKAPVAVLEGRNYNQPSRRLMGAQDFISWELLEGRTSFSRATLPEMFLSASNLALWSKLFRTDFVSDPLLHSAGGSHDIAFVGLALALAENVAVVPGDFVRHRINADLADNFGIDAEVQDIVGEYSVLREALAGIIGGDSVESAVRASFFSALRCWISSVKDDQVRCVLLDELNASAEFKEELAASAKARSLPLTVEDDVAFLEAALSQRAHMQRAEEPVKAACVASASCDRPLVSVVMPVYNAMPYVTDAVRSILDQEHVTLELICVNDGSSDGSLNELVALASQDERMTVLTQENRGQSQARNAGMGASRGEYLYFMDSDDVLAPEALHFLTGKMEQLELDLLFFDGCSFYENAELEELNPWFKYGYQREHEYSSVAEGAELIARMHRNGEYLQSPCLYLARRSLAENNDVRFIPGVLHEDNAFTFAMALASRRCSHVGERLFHRRVRDDSTMTSNTNFSKVYGFFSCAQAMARSYVRAESHLDAECRGELKSIIAQMLSNARRGYKNLPAKYHGCEFGLGDDKSIFIAEVRDVAQRELELEREVQAYASSASSVHPRGARRLAGRLSALMRKGVRRQ